MSKNSQILLVTFAYREGLEGQPFSILTRLREKIFKKMGFKTLKFNYPKKGGRFKFLRYFLQVLKLSRQAQLVYIPVDGGIELENFSLLKLFNPSLTIIWGIEAPPEEHFWKRRGFKAKIRVFWGKTKRRFLAELVSGATCVSEELKKYSQKTLKIDKSFVIANFVDDQIINKVLKPNFPKDAINLFLETKGVFKVLWGGGSIHRWQALDLVEKVAKKVYRIDKEVVFFIVGTNSWHQFTFFKNIVFLESLPQENFFNLVKLTDLCLALYHRPDFSTIPFYFSPLKTIEFMALAKPVIATGDGAINELIEDGKDGLLTDNTVNDLVKKIIFLKKNPSVARKMGRKASLKMLKEHGFERATKDHLRAFTGFGFQPPRRSSLLD